MGQQELPLTLSTTDRQARDALVVLVRHVFEQEDGFIEPMTYQALARKIDRFDKNGDPVAIGMGHHVLGRMGEMLARVAGAWQTEIPYLQTIVVQKSGPDQGLPDVGVKGLWPAWESWARSEKENMLRVEYARILRFGDTWNEVLKYLALEPILIPRATSSDGAPRGRSGGESPEHKALKQYLRDHPEVIGLDATWKCEPEYPLPSADKIDLMFKAEHKWLGVEVKSIVSDRDPSDYERGIYQVVKYRAVLRGMSKAEADMKIQITPRTGAIDVVLVLQSTLPQKYLHAAQANGVKYYELVNAASKAPVEAIDREGDTALLA